MPTYEYIIRDLLSPTTVVDEIELSDVFCSRQMNTEGRFQGSFNLFSDDPLRAARYLDCTKPGRYGIEMRRNSTPIWGGIIWSRTWSAINQQMQLYASSWESYFDHMVFWKNHFIQQKVNQELIFQAIVTQLQGQSAAANIGLTISSLPTTNIKRTVLIPNYEYHFGSEAISQVVGVDLGLEYTIHPDRTIELAAEGQLNASTDKMTYDFPGTVESYSLPESGAAAAIKLATLGAGSGNKILRTVSEDQNRMNAGYPEWWKVTQYPEIADLGVLRDKNIADFNTYQMPFATPSFDIQIEEGFDRFNDIGATVEVTLTDPRFPSPATFSTRMMGWELQPQTDGQVEQLKIQVDGGAWS